MPITDLTNTTWVLNQTINNLGYDVGFDINFTTHEENYSVNCSSLLFESVSDGFLLVYNSNYVAYDSTNNGWTYQTYRVIQITGGDDVTNSTLISWLQTNAIQTITNLAGTSWVFNEIINVNPLILNTHYEFDINYYLTNDSEAEGNQIQLDSAYDESEEYYIFYNGIDTAYMSESGGWQNNNFKAITITDGDDEENIELISWLYCNATLQNEHITDLTGTTWQFNNSLSGVVTYSVSGNVGNQTYTPYGFSYIDSQDVYGYDIFSFYYSSIDPPYSIGDGFIYIPENTLGFTEGWNFGNTEDYSTYTSTDAPTMTITGGTDVTNSNLIEWLYNNATLVSITRQYEITETLTNLTSGNKTIQITPDTGYYLPSSITVTNGTLVSYSSTTGIAVISGDNAVVNVECSDTQAVSGYSGNIAITVFAGSLSTSSYIKFDSAPTSDVDYNSAVSNGVLYGDQSYTNKSVVYIWGNRSNNGVIINNHTTTGGLSYDTAVQLNLTEDATIYLKCYATSG